MFDESDIESDEGIFVQLDELVKWTESLMHE